MSDINNIAFLIPITSHNCYWNSINDSYLVNNLLKSIVNTCSNNKLTFYLGIDSDEKIYTKENIKTVFNSIKKNSKSDSEFNCDICFDITTYVGIKKGYLTKMWNILYEKAYKTGLHNYYYQCGDDIYFKDKGWLTLSIDKLKSMNDIGIAGPKTLRKHKKGYKNEHIMTQVLISNLHYKLFGKLFPEELINWYCDDWLNFIYKDRTGKLNTHGCVNYSLSNNNRYKFSKNDKSKFLKLAEKDIKIVLNYIENSVC